MKRELFGYKMTMMMLALLTGLVSLATATTVGPPMNNGPQNTAGIEIGWGEVWQADMSSYTNWLADVHFLLGDYGTPGTSDIQYNDAAGFGFTGGHFVISRNANVRTGHVVYKFTVADGYVTGENATITADTMFHGTPSTQGSNLWLGVSTTFEHSAEPSYSNLNNYLEFDKVTYGASDGTEYGLYNKTMTVAIPAGVTEFYVAVSESPGYSSGRFGVGSLSVDPDLVLGEIPVLLWTSAAHELMTYKWGHETENTVGMSGYVVGGITMSADPCAAEISDAAIEAMTAGRALGIDTYAYRLSMGYAAPEFSATTFQPPAAAAGDPNDPNDLEWNHFKSLMTTAAQECGNNDIAVLIIDVEKYDSGIDYSDYLFTKGNDPCEMYWAYQRGAELGEIIQQYAPNMAVMMIPEHECATYWGGANGSWQTANRFRNGLMSVSEPRLRVWIGTEGTYGLNGDINDTAISLRINNSMTYFTDPCQYATALETYLDGVAADCRASTDDPAVWDVYGGIATGFSVLGVASSPEGQQSAWYTPEMFAVQMETYREHPMTRLIWSWCWRFPYAQWSYNEVAAAGLGPYDGNLSNPDYWTSYYAQVTKHPYLEAYLEVIKARGVPATGWISRLESDVNTDSYVNTVDLSMMANEWLDVSPKNGD